MSARPAVGGRGVVAGVLNAAADWLVEPAERADQKGRGGATMQERPVVAVIGLTPRCGTSTVARGLGAELALRDVGGSCAVTAAPAGPSLPLGFPAAGRLARTLAPVASGATRACGRLCLVYCEDRAALAGAIVYLAPLVLDVGGTEQAAAAAAIADRVVLVAGPSSEPALAAVVSDSLARAGPVPLVVLNRADSAEETWTGRAAVELPDSRMGAQLALAGREPRGQLGRAVAGLADMVGGRA